MADLSSIQPLPEPLPDKLDELQKLVEKRQDWRLKAKQNVQQQREIMDECDRQIARLKDKVNQIMGVNGVKK